MSINRITFSGADESVEVEDLLRIQANYYHEPIQIEWGILLSEDRMGTPRYPGQGWLLEVEQIFPEFLSLAWHICGSEKYVDQVMFYSQFGEDRVQLNVAVRDSKEKLNTVSSILTKKTIVPFNLANTELIKLIQTRGLECPYLYDSSGGKGKSPVKWLAPLPNHYCGYAGGLGPDNIVEEAKKINEVSGDTAVWIDMETGVRTDEKFDPYKVETVINAVLKLKGQ